MWCSGGDVPSAEEPDPPACCGSAARHPAPHVLCAVSQSPSSFLAQLRPAEQPGVIPAQVHDFALVAVEFLKVPAGSFLQLVSVLLDGSPALEFVVMCRPGCLL